MLFLLCYNLKIVAQWEGGIDFWWGGNKNLVGGEGGVHWGEFFQVGGGGEMSRFLTSGGTPPIPSNRENPTDSLLSRKLESEIFFFLDHLQILHRYFLHILYFLLFSLYCYLKFFHFISTYTSMTSHKKLTKIIYKCAQKDRLKQHIKQ